MQIAVFPAAQVSASLDVTASHFTEWGWTPRTLAPWGKLDVDERY